MATETFIPSLWRYTPDYDPYNAANAYSDTSSGTYSECAIDEGTYLFLGGFDVGSILGTVTSVTVKVKAGFYQESSSEYVNATLYSSESGVAISSVTSIPSSDSPSVITLTLTASASSIISYGDTLGIKFTGSGYFGVYGAEVIVQYTLPPIPNKVKRGNTTVIDLSMDTVRREDVAFGAVFHLPNGYQTTGKGVKPVCISSSGAAYTTARELSISGLTHQPSWFVLIATESNYSRTDRLYHIIFDGSNLRAFSGGANAGKVVECDSGMVSFSYSNGSIDFVSSYHYFSTGFWELYYI